MEIYVKNIIGKIVISLLRIYFSFLSFVHETIQSENIAIYSYYFIEFYNSFTRFCYRIYKMIYIDMRN